MTRINKKNRFIAFMLVLMLVMAIMPMGAMAAGSYPGLSGVAGMDVQFGDPSYVPPAYDYVSPEQDMVFSGSGSTYQVNYSGPFNNNNISDQTSYYPNVLAFYVTSGVQNITAITSGTGITYQLYDASATGYAPISDVASIPGGTTTLGITITILSGSVTRQLTVTTPSGSLVLNFNEPVVATASGGATPDSASGYLPIGQYSRPNSPWGSLFTDNTNLGTAPPKTAKGTAGYTSTGVSLGLLGGYVQYDMGENSVISNDPENPYGIDFILYGNPFVGNPEAASVMVSNDGVTWYNLAGSLHYNDETNWNVDISYIKITTANTTIGSKTFLATGIYYSKDYVVPALDDQASVTAAISAATWSVSNTGSPFNVNWWPEIGNNENYENVYRIDPYIGSNVAWYSQNGVAEVITYKGVTEVMDDAAMGITNSTDATNYYKWGYADIRAAGSSYGDAINPYASLPASGSGGDGFDLSWAVNADGSPEYLESVRYVRVYSAVLWNAGIFGETSAEICGLYVANGEGDGASVSDLEIWNYGETQDYPTTNMGTRNLNAGSYKLYASDSKVYINGTAITGAATGYSFNIAAGDIMQIVTQDGTRSPYITVIKGV